MYKEIEWINNFAILGINKWNELYLQSIKQSVNKNCCYSPPDKFKIEINLPDIA